MNTPRLRRCLILGLAVWTLATASDANAQASFDALGDLAGGSFASFASAVSADGLVVVGSSRSAASAASGSISDAEAFRWSEETGMAALGDLPGGSFNSHAVGVSGDGQVIAGVGTLGVSVTRAFRWTAATRMQDLGVISASSNPASTAMAVSDDGLTIVGSSTSARAGGSIFLTREAFVWTPSGGMVGIGFIGDSSGATDSSARGIGANGDFIVGHSSSRDSAILGPGREAFIRTRDGQFEGLGFAEECGTSAAAVSDDGTVVVGVTTCLSGSSGAFRWTRSGGLRLFGDDSVSLRDVSADGAIAVGEAENRATIWFEDSMFFLEDVLATQTDIDLADRSLREAVGISADGLTIVGNSRTSGGFEAWRLRLSDCNGNRVPDELEIFLLADTATKSASAGTEFFAGDDRGGVATYRSMIASYGRPWLPDTEQTPARVDPDLASRLRALVVTPECGVALVERYYRDVALVAANELFHFEMLLGNEAFADAIDVTIGLDGIPSADIGDLFAFDGVAGIRTLLDERLALLRGRELAGSPADWLDDSVHFPQITDAIDTVRVAIYHRLPPNASESIAYRSNYGLNDDLDGALSYPQGHGDAYGYYLRAEKTYIDLVREDPPIPGGEGVVDALLSPADGEAAINLRENFARAAVARARAAGEIVGTIFRRDYREDPADPRREDLFADIDPQRAGSAAEWARRGAVGAYLDWALLHHMAPEGDTPGAAERESLMEAGELASEASTLQERIDTAAGGLDPLGLVRNVVPFGIDAASLDVASGRSHYEQVRDAAVGAIQNARNVLELANRAGERVSEQGDDLDDFRAALEDQREDFNQRLIEIFGQPSADDPADNDLDPGTDDLTESRELPDLVNPFVDDARLASIDFRPRPAPGQIQLAMSELAVAELRVDEAAQAIKAWQGAIEDVLGRIELITDIRREEIEIIAEACDEEVELVGRLEEATRGNFAQKAFDRLRDAGTTPVHGVLAIAQIFYDLNHYFDEDEFDIEQERIRLECWKDTRLGGLEFALDIDAEQRKLNALVRESPQLTINLAIARELASQSLGRLRASLQRGLRLIESRRRVEETLREDLIEARWKDLAFRNFRNNALAKYAALFDLAARYVVLAARAYAYEFNTRAEGDNVLTGVYTELRLGNPTGNTGGLQGVIARLDASVVVNNFNRPLETLGQLSFSLRENLLGIRTGDTPEGDLAFRDFLESSIVQQLEEVLAIRDSAQLSIERDFGPAIVVPFSTEVASRNFFGEGPEPPFGNINFSLTRNPKIRTFAVRLDGVNADLGIDPVDGGITAYLIPVGDSILRENNNRPRIEDEPTVSWAVVDQFLPAPPAVTAAVADDRSFNPWRDSAQSGGSFLNSIKRHRDVRAQLELGQPPFFNTTLAGRSAWNTAWLLAIPGSQWTSSSEPFVIRSKLLQLIYGDSQDPAELDGITDVRLIIQAYTH